VNRALPLALPLLAALVASPAPVTAQEYSPVEAKLRQEAAADLVALAKWCAQAGARTEGNAVLEEARLMDVPASDTAEVEKELAALAYDSSDATTLAKKKSEVGKELARKYERMAGLKHDDAEEARFIDYALRAIRWEPSEARLKAGLAMASSAASGNRLMGVCRLLTGLRRADPAGAARGRYDALEEKLAAKDAALIGSRGHDLVAYVSLPRDWKRGRGWPVLLGVEGAGCNFAGYAKGLAGSRGSRPVIVVVPVTLSNTNELLPVKYPSYSKALLDRWNDKRLEFDYKGIEAIATEVRDRFGGEEKVFLTGFSGGGLYCYYRLLQVPTGVRGAVLCCANYSGFGSDTSPGAGPGGGPPVHILTGEKDEHREFILGDKNQPGIEPQTDKAVETLKQLGFTSVRRTMLKGVGHSPLPDQVWKFVDESLGGK